MKARHIRIFRGFDNLPHFVHPAVTVGSFDGVHPRITLGRAAGLQLLTPLDEKIALLERLGVDHVVVIPFDKAFSALSGREFVLHYLIGRLGAETLVAGYDHRFGHNRAGSTAMRSPHWGSESSGSMSATSGAPTSVRRPSAGSSRPGSSPRPNGCWAIRSASPKTKEQNKPIHVITRL